MARVRLTVAERREELLRAAIEQIEARGVAAVRIADVASALGVSNALVLYHFATKEKLVAAAFTYAAGPEAYVPGRGRSSVRAGVRESGPGSRRSLALNAPGASPSSRARASSTHSWVRVRDTAPA